MPELSHAYSQPVFRASANAHLLYWKQLLDIKPRISAFEFLNLVCFLNLGLYDLAVAAVTNLWDARMSGFFLDYPK